MQKKQYKGFTELLQLVLVCWESQYITVHARELVSFWVVVRYKHFLPPGYFGQPDVESCVSALSGYSREH